MVKMEDVKSSNIHSIGYDTDAKELYVKFKGGTTYLYSDVPNNVYDRLKNAESKGGFLGKEIKGVYGFKKVDNKGEENKEELYIIILKEYAYNGATTSIEKDGATYSLKGAIKWALKKICEKK